MEHGGTVDPSESQANGWETTEEKKLEELDSGASRGHSPRLHPHAEHPTAGSAETEAGEQTTARTDWSEQLPHSADQNLLEEAQLMTDPSEGSRA